MRAARARELRPRPPPATLPVTLPAPGSRACTRSRSHPPPLPSTCCVLACAVSMRHYGWEEGERSHSHPPPLPSTCRVRACAVSVRHYGWEEGERARLQSTVGSAVSISDADGYFTVQDGRLRGWVGVWVVVCGWCAGGVFTDHWKNGWLRGWVGGWVPLSVCCECVQSSPDPPPHRTPPHTQLPAGDDARAGAPPAVALRRLPPTLCRAAGHSPRARLPHRGH